MEANADIKSYVEYSEEYLKLKVFKIFMASVTSMTQILMIGALLLLALFFLSTAISMALGTALGNTVYGFMIVGIFYIVVGILLTVFRDRIDRPILRKFSKHFFDKE